MSALGGRRDGQPAEAAELGRREVLADGPAELVGVEGEGLILVVDPDLRGGELVHGRQVTVGARAVFSKRAQLIWVDALMQGEGWLCGAVRARARGLRKQRLAAHDRPRRPRRRAEGAEAADQRVVLAAGVDAVGRQGLPRAVRRLGQEAPGLAHRPEHHRRQHDHRPSRRACSRRRRSARRRTAPTSTRSRSRCSSSRACCSRSTGTSRGAAARPVPERAQGDDRAPTATSTPGGGRPTCACSTAAPTSSRRRRRPGTS